MEDVAVLEAPHARQEYVIDEGQKFRNLFNAESFEFEQRLSECPLFELDHLAALSTRLPFTYHTTSQAPVAGGWQPSIGTARDLPRVITAIANSDALVMLRRVEQDEIFGPVLRDVQAELVRRAGPKLEQDISIGRATILISSPQRVTSYHMDHDTNYLLQIRGDKKISVFDGSDRSLVTEPELEAYYAGDLNSAVYKESRQKDATVYHLRPGTGVHVPSHSPHWVQNHESVSVSVSFNFDLRSLMRLGRVYKVNHHLRRVGLKPKSPGLDRHDTFKLAFDRCATGIQRMGRQLTGRGSHG